MKQTQKFNPIDFGFHRLDCAMGDLRFYERQLNFATSTKPNYFRLNIYLSQDGDFVTVWFGLFETFSVDQLIEEMGIDINANQQYNEPLFRGYIDNNDVANTILDALRLDKFTPQVIQVKPGEFRCDILSKAID